MMVALAAFAMMVATAVPAGAGVVEDIIEEGGFVYFGDGVIVLTGPPLEQGCVGEGFRLVPAKLIQPGNGSFQVKFSEFGEQINVFEDPIGVDPFTVFDWIDAACDAIVDGDPNTVAPEPLAVGEGKLTFQVKVDPDGVAEIQNWIVGEVETADGETVHLSAFAKFTEGPGILEFNQIRVNYGG